METALMKHPKSLLILVWAMVALNIATAGYFWLYIKRERYEAAIVKGEGILNVLDYGAVCDGVTDDSDAFNAAFEDAAARRVSIMIPGRTCIINSRLMIHDNLVIRSEGATLKHGRGSGEILAAISADDWVINGPLTLAGTRTNVSREGDETGLLISGANRFMVDKLTVRDFKGTGIRLTGGKPSRAARGDRGKFAFITFINNHVGLSLEAEKKYAAEYNLFTLMSFSGNDVAAHIVAGNNIISTSNIVDNTNGILLSGGTNHGHGIMSAVNVNHSRGYNLKADNITNGYTFDGCHIYGDMPGSVLLGQSTGVDFTGCIVDPAPQMK